MYIKVNNGVVEKYPYSLYDLRSDNPNTSFPADMPDDILAEFGIYSVSHTEAPNVDHTKNVYESTPVIIGGVWTQVWVISDASSEQIAERLNSAWAALRDERNKKLSSTDWTQGKDIADSISLAWAKYRQELRDLPENTSDPFNPVWPSKPKV